MKVKCFKCKIKIGDTVVHKFSGLELLVKDAKTLKMVIKSGDYVKIIKEINE